MNIAIEVPCLWDVHGALAGGAVPGAGAASGVAVEAPLAARALLSLRVVQACLQDEREENFICSPKKDIREFFTSQFTSSHCTYHPHCTSH